MGSNLDNINIVELWEKFTLQPCNEEQDFFESGGNSLSAVDMVIEIQTKYKIEISLEQFMKDPSVTYLKKIIKNRS